MEKGKKSFKDYPVRETYPYPLVGIAEEVRAVSEKKKDDDVVELMATDGSGEIIPYKKKRVTSRNHDSLSYTKIFHQHCERMKGLSVPAFYLFHYIADNIKVGKPFIKIKESHFLDSFGYSPSSIKTFYQAACELLEIDVIQKVANEDRTYWVNANIIFNGDRTRMLDEETNENKYAQKGML